MNIDIKNNIDKAAKGLPKLGARLESALDFVEQGKVVADIGTDHAYLPIYLVGNGKITKAVAADINEGPIERAKENISEYGMQNQILAIRTDGLCGIEKYAPRNIIIFGMGAELIVKIIKEAGWVYNPEVRLIMQPMTHAEILRKFLAEEGFDVIGETLTKEGKLYQTIAASYDGINRDAPVGYIYGGGADLKKSEFYVEFISNQLRILKKASDGAKKAGKESAETDMIIKELQNILTGCL